MWRLFGKLAFAYLTIPVVVLADPCGDRVEVLAIKPAYKIKEVDRAVQRLTELDLDNPKDVERIGRNISLILRSPGTRFSKRREILGALFKKLESFDEEITFSELLSEAERKLDPSASLDEIERKIAELRKSREAHLEQKYLSDIYEPADFQISLRYLLHENLKGLLTSVSNGDYLSTVLLIEFIRRWNLTPALSKRPQYLEEVFEKTLQTTIQNWSGIEEYLNKYVINAPSPELARVKLLWLSYFLSFYPKPPETKLTILLDDFESLAVFSNWLYANLPRLNSEKLGFKTIHTWTSLAFRLGGSFRAVDSEGHVLQALDLPNLLSEKSMNRLGRRIDQVFPNLISTAKYLEDLLLSTPALLSERDRVIEDLGFDPDSISPEMQNRRNISPEKLNSSRDLVRRWTRIRNLKREGILDYVSRASLDARAFPDDPHSVYWLLETLAFIYRDFAEYYLEVHLPEIWQPLEHLAPKDLSTRDRARFARQLLRILP